MSDALFWFDHRNRPYVDDARLAADGDPEKVIKAFKGDLGGKGVTQRQLSPDLWNMWQKPLTHVEIMSDFALFMRGTTDDLVKAVERDVKKDIRRLVIIGADILEIRYIRHKAGLNKTVSIVGIAAKHGYWQSVPAYPVGQASRLKTWAQLRSYKFEPTPEWTEALEQYGLEEREWGKDLNVSVSIDYSQLKPIIEGLRDSPAWT